jgi:hypothetical protein
MCASYIVRMMYVGKHISPLLYPDVHFGTMLCTHSVNVVWGLRFRVWTLWEP